MYFGKDKKVSFCCLLLRAEKRTRIESRCFIVQRSTQILQGLVAETVFLAAHIDSMVRDGCMTFAETFDVREVRAASWANPPGTSYHVNML